MATSAYASTPETTYANRTSRALLGPCSDQLRDVLRHYVPPNTFPHVISHYRSNLPRLTPPQIGLVSPRTGHYSGNYSDMDISLLYILLRNICNIPPHKNGWGKSPDVNDKFLAASIERIREARNKIGHSSSTSLSYADFTYIWSYIKDAVKSMDAFLNNGKKYEKEMDFLFTETMDPEQEEFYINQLRKQVEDDKQTKETVKRLQESVNDQRGDIKEIRTDQQESNRQLRHQHGVLQYLQYQQQELQRQQTYQHGGIQYIQYQQQELHRQQTNQHGGIQYMQYQQQELQRQQTYQHGDMQDIQYQQKELQRQQTDQQEGIQYLKYQQQELQRQQTYQHGDIQYLQYQQQELQRQQTDQQGDIQDIQYQQQELQRQQTYQHGGIQYIQYQQQELQRQQTDQQGGIQVLQYQQQELQRQQTDQHGGIQILQYQQQELQRQHTDQLGGIQVLQYQQQELQRQQTNQQGGIQDLQYQQQESYRQLTYQQGSIQDLRSQQQELQRQQTDQYTTLTDRLQVHSTQIADLAQTHVIPDEEPDLNRLKERLVEINDLEIPLTPLQEDSEKLPVEQLFASVIIKEDSKETRKGKKSAQGGKEQERKEVKTPEDLLTKNGKPVRRVYMLGDAAHGKTTYCTWLLKKWCNAQKPGMSGRPMNEWENALSQFDFVFHVKFRKVDPTRTNVIDMICQYMLGEDTVLHTAAKHVLSSDKYRCLIIMDGLDEWKSDQLKHEGMPYIDNMSNCVIFTTMRPWMFAAVAGLVRDEDRVIEIQGLDDKGIKDVIEQVLVHYYEMEPDSDEYTAKYYEIILKLYADKTLKSFIHIPLLAVVCIQIWCTGKQVGNSLTSFYSVMIDMLIDRAKVNIKTLEEKKNTYSLPEILTENENIINHISILLKLGKVAYEGLLSNKENLEFQKRKLEKELGREELQFALDVGLISQTEAPSITTRNVNVHFFHKSVQEFLAATYIVTQKKVSDNFCTRLCNVKVIMELSNVIMFICGMCPSLGSDISQRVVSVTDNDGGICKYRESTELDNDTPVKELYKLQVSWYRELQYGQTDSPVTDSPVTDSPVTFHVSDVYLVGYSDTETVRVNRELLSGHHDIRSLTLFLVPTDGEDGITDTELGDFLSDTDKTRSLVRLYINGGDTGRSVHTLCGPSLRTLCLWRVTIQDRDSVRPVITQTDRLQRLELRYVRLGDRGLGLTPHITDLQRVELYTVSMTQSGWGRLIQSVIDIHHQFDVTLLETDIDSDSVSTLHSSPHISVNVILDGRNIMFTRLWPLTQDDDNDNDDDDDDDDDTVVGI